MKIIVWFSLCFVFFFLVPSTFGKETITIAYLDYCPYQCVPGNENGKEGYAVEMQKIIFARAGITVKTTLVPFARALKGLEAGRYDASPTINTNHSKLIILSNETSAVLRQIFYVKKGDPWRYSGVESLRKVHIGTIPGYNYSSFSPEYEAYIQQNKGNKAVQYVGGEDAQSKNFLKILKGRITTFNEDAGLAQYITTKMGINDQFDEAGQLGNNIQYMGFSPKNPNSGRYVEIYDSGIRALRKSGELEEILKKYGIMDWKHYIE